MRYYCKCGVYFGTKRWLIEHIGICNPHWPRTNATDEHIQVDEADWNAKRNEAYKRLREAS